MPLRALGYIASAITVAATHLPKAEIQMVHTLHSAERVNRRDISLAREQAKRLASLSERVLEDSLPRVNHLLDPDEPLAIEKDAIAAAIASLPDHAKEKLHRVSPRRGDMFDYVTAHLQMHDTTAQLSPLRHADIEPMVPKRIISLGAQSERPFYLARMACRNQGLAIPDQVEDTAQIFTKHVLPPYVMCREGEPHINELDRTYPLRQPLEWDYDPLYEKLQPNASVARDLAFVAEFLSTQPPQ